MWSWKKPTDLQVLKFSLDNLVYYFVWLYTIYEIPWLHLKFLDESHFNTRSLRRNKVVGPIGQRTGLVQIDEVNESYSLTLLIDLAFPDNPFFISLRTNTNSEQDYLDFITTALLSKHLVAGDFLIVDNASIHFGGNTWEELTTQLEQHGVRYLFLPTYSPELNPCELVFAAVKSFIRNYPGQRNNLKNLIFQGLAHVSYFSILNFYNECTSIIYQLNK